nr:endo-1,4-beta-xylanase [uncultured Marinifilum sp.]
MKKISGFSIWLLFACSLILSSCSGSGESEEEFELGSPIAKQATDITSTGFTASWSRVYKADSYLLDVAKDIDFTNFLSGYNSKPLSDLNADITGLEANVSYFYRVRAVKESTVSASSNIIELTTSFEPDANQTLKNSSDNFLIGVALQSSKLNGSYDELYKNEFSSITAEYEMKMNITHPTQDSYDFGPADAIVDYAQENGINVHGHSLIWHNSTPDWVSNFQGSDQEFEDMIEEYITKVVTRYKGKVTSWDVVNEAFEDGSGQLRNSIYRQRMGDDYIAKCYQFVRAADPDVLIFYNDYSMVSDQTKQNAVFAMADDFIARDIPIDGLGFQLHIQYDYPAKADIEAAVQKVVDRNLLMHFSELDIRVNPNNDLTSLTNERSLAQKAKYKEMVEILKSIPEESAYALTVWGLIDSESWLINFYGQQDWPLLFDSKFEKKDAYYGFLEGLQ